MLKILFGVRCHHEINSNARIIIDVFAVMTMRFYYYDRKIIILLDFHL